MINEASFEEKTLTLKVIQYHHENSGTTIP